MAISDLKAGQGKVNIELQITQVEPPRAFDKFGKSGQVANAVGQDASGTIKLSLWNEQVDQVKAGDKVKITNGWVSEWRGELQLSTGKFGNLEVLGKTEADPPVIVGGGSEMGAGMTAPATPEMPEEEFLDEQEE
ncbi:MAG TPA: SOSS complex subunit B family protein [Candidatus Nanoarchaeia archaeon]|nr:SOSS complex subunit B family protein [Candidatus Nanoarchaeia archaeon]